MSFLYLLVDIVTVTLYLYTILIVQRSCFSLRIFDYTLPYIPHHATTYRHMHMSTTSLVVGQRSLKHLNVSQLPKLHSERAHIHKCVPSQHSGFQNAFCTSEQEALHPCSSDQTQLILQPVHQQHRH